MENLTVQWIGQSGYIISAGKTQICIDPYLSDVVNRVAGRARMVEPCILPREIKSNAVICTHNHLDHVDIDAIPLMNKENITFYAPRDAEKQLLECGVTSYAPFDEGDTCTIGDFKITAVYAKHSVPAIGVIMEYNSVKMYFSGDTLYDERLRALKEHNIDVMFICINGKLGNMNVDEAVQLTKEISPKVGIPTHYGMFESNTEDPEKYTSRIANGVILEYGKVYSIGEVLKNV